MCCVNTTSEITHPTTQSEGITLSASRVMMTQPSRLSSNGTTRSATSNSTPQTRQQTKSDLRTGVREDAFLMVGLAGFCVILAMLVVLYLHLRGRNPSGKDTSSVYFNFPNFY